MYEQYLRALLAPLGVYDLNEGTVNGAELYGAMDNHKAYIQSWIKAIEDKPNELFAAIKDAETISDYLLEKGEFQLENSLTPDLEELPEIQETRKASLDEKIRKASGSRKQKAPSQKKSKAMEMVH